MYAVVANAGLENFFVDSLNSLDDSNDAFQLGSDLVKFSNSVGFKPTKCVSTAPVLVARMKNPDARKKTG